MIGQKGLPATYGGIERHVEELGTRLAARGHDVTVFCRTGYSKGHREHGGVRLRYVPSVRTKHLDAIVHSGLSTVASMMEPPDVLHYHALGPGLVAPVPRYLSRSKVVLTVHGLDHDRAKWGAGARTVLRAAAWMSAHVPDATIGVSSALVKHYRTHFDRSIHYIPNGVTVRTPRRAAQITNRYGLVQGSYVLFVGRLVPEKAPDVLIRAFRRVPTELRLVIVGGSSFTDGYASMLRQLAAADPRVLLTGFVFGAELEELYSNAAAFVLPSSLEGLPLTLLEAISYGTPVVASDIAPHAEILGESGPGRRLFSAGDERSLACALNETITSYADEFVEASLFSKRVIASYDWDEAVDATEALYERLVCVPTVPPQRVTSGRGIRTRPAPSRSGMHSSKGTGTSGPAPR